VIDYKFPFPTMDYSNCPDTLKEDVDYYKRIIGITDWSISVQVLPSRYVGTGEEKTMGLCSYSREHRAAVVRLATQDADFYEYAGSVHTTSFCMENTLIHELLHTIFGDDCDEQLVERTARAVLLARYGLSEKFFDISEITVG